MLHAYTYVYMYVCVMFDPFSLFVSVCLGSPIWHCGVCKQVETTPVSQVSALIVLSVYM